ncbi:hypothetical protein FNV43_RR19878 [Rhamnella rubrinervis]|uniref:Uncharacterized protein n=1 Tax=Rhamnella rubrinervis TaxID=2594499 RepID=A0A8K0GWL5_9ROSA|nr:hypothetical protein FNV43_RR19878 [Rhamnella rubrinervis]
MKLWWHRYGIGQRTSDVQVNINLRYGLAAKYSLRMHTFALSDDRGIYRLSFVFLTKIRVENPSRLDLGWKVGVGGPPTRTYYALGGSVGVDGHQPPTDPHPTCTLGVCGHPPSTDPHPTCTWGVGGHQPPPTTTFQFELLGPHVVKRSESQAPVYAAEVEPKSFEFEALMRLEVRTYQAPECAPDTSSIIVEAPDV